MFSEILKIVPKLSNRDLNNMEKGLNKRFTKVAKRFGKGISSIFMSGGLIGLALGFVTKILNPLKEVQEAIDRTLTKNDDLSTFAKQFGTDSGKFAKLVALGEGSGISQNDLVYIMTKFQTSLAEQRAGTRDVGLSNFVDIEDTSDAFFSFIQNLAKLDKGTSALIQKQVFGERQILKTADFLQQNFAERFKEIGLDKISTDKLTQSIEKVAGLSDLTDALAANRNIKDIIAKAGVINEAAVRGKDKAERIKLERENQKINAVEDLRAISNTTQAMLKVLESSIEYIGKGIRSITDGFNKIIVFFDSWDKKIPSWLKKFGLGGK